MVSMGYNYEQLPYYIPLVPFPSSEIIVASCKYDLSKERLREIRPTPGLKIKVYNTDSIPYAIESGNLNSTLEKYMINEKINEIYREIPETRMLIHALIN